MKAAATIPAQIRAARGLLDWSQEQLATAAEVALTSVRDLESERRSGDAGTGKSVRRALENAGVDFVAGSEGAGPGVRLVANRPSIIRRPTTMTRWDGLPFTVELQGKEITVLVRRDALDDLGRFTSDQPDAAYIKVFEQYRGDILDGVRQAAADVKNYDNKGFLYVGAEYLRALA